MHDEGLRYLRLFVLFLRHYDSLIDYPMPKLLKPRKRRLGRKDKADFVEFALSGIDIKIDTGAYTSSIHCHYIREMVVDEQKVISFRLLDPGHKQYNNQEYQTSQYKQKVIRSSNGKAEKRFVIKTTIQLYETTYPIELSLSERGEMRFPVLIGRKFLIGRFTVDPAKFDLSWAAKHPSPKPEKKPSPKKSTK